MVWEKKYKIGDLIKMKISMQFSREEHILIGDYGIVIQTTVSEGNPIPFDYLVCVNGIDLFVFSEEIELITEEV